mmetsp:Transcript_23639/g.68350  ORF Transcript_23639/g.68350 Transcript_23639/m.68350 type:complete len:398 (-) Transcript_23639:2-1195(-)
MLAANFAQQRRQFSDRRQGVGMACAKHRLSVLHGTPEQRLGLLDVPAGLQDCGQPEVECRGVLGLRREDTFLVLQCLNQELGQLGGGQVAQGRQERRADGGPSGAPVGERAEEEPLGLVVPLLMALPSGILPFAKRRLRGARGEQLRQSAGRGKRLGVPRAEELGTAPSARAEEPLGLLPHPHRVEQLAQGVRRGVLRLFGPPLGLLLLLRRRRRRALLLRARHWPLLRAPTLSGDLAARLEDPSVGLLRQILSVQTHEQLAEVAGDAERVGVLRSQEPLACVPHMDEERLGLLVLAHGLERHRRGMPCRHGVRVVGAEGPLPAAHDAGKQRACLVVSSEGLQEHGMAIEGRHGLQVVQAQDILPALQDAEGQRHRVLLSPSLAEQHREVLRGDERV